VTQPSLFDPPTHRNAGLTERIAAEWMKKKSGKMRLTIYRQMFANGPRGLTRPEADVICNSTPNVTQPRIWELAGNGDWPTLIVRTRHKRRLTPESCPATVWVAVEFKEEAA
jgi:hypothetical protein